VEAAHHLQGGLWGRGAGVGVGVAVDAGLVAGGGVDLLSAFWPTTTITHHHPPSPTITHHYPPSPTNHHHHQELVKEMVDEDLVLARRDMHSVGGGFQQYSTTPR